MTEPDTLSFPEKDLYRLLKALDLNPWYPYTHGDEIADGESYCVPRDLGAVLPGAAGARHALEVICRTKADLVGRNQQVHRDYLRDVRQALRVAPDDIIKDTLLCRKWHVRFTGLSSTELVDGCWQTSVYLKSWEGTDWAS